jgi:hypothetical protein
LPPLAMFLILFMPAPVTPNICNTVSRCGLAASELSGAYGDDDAIRQERLEGNRHSGGFVGLFNGLAFGPVVEIALESYAKPLLPASVNDSFELVDSKCRGCHPDWRIAGWSGNYCLRHSLQLQSLWILVVHKTDD